MTMTEYEELMNDTRLFYRLPKRLVEDPAFEEMSIDAKMLYMILLDRRCLSEINGGDWRDDHGCIFIYFTIEEMMRLMNCGNKKINELLKELEKYDLVRGSTEGWESQTGFMCMIFFHRTIQIGSPE